MKKAVILILALVWLTFPGITQQGNGFKSINKQLPGTTKHDLTFKNISGRNNLKSTAGYLKQPISGKLVVLELKNDDPVKNLIRVSGYPVYFEKGKQSLKSGHSISAEEQFYSFFNETKSVTKLTDPWEELKILKISEDEFGIIHVKAQQVFHGIEIYGAESYLHIGKDKDIFTGRIISVKPQVIIIPSLSAENAFAKAKSDVGTKTLLRELSAAEKSFLGYVFPETGLVIYEGKLAYKISIRPNFIEEWRYFIDAGNGEILFSYNNTNSDGPATANALDLNGVSRTVNTYLDNGTYLLINASEEMYNNATGEGLIMTLDANNTSAVALDYDMITSTNNTWNIPAGISAHYNAKQTYHYLKTTFNRNSLNNMGGNIISFINVAEEDGTSMENAFWNGKAVFYGNGGSAFRPLPGALDVAAHELGHGVISNTANLEYYGQSGAINESYADIFGSMVDREDWYVGEDVTKTSFSPSGRLRDMSDPHNRGTSLNEAYWQPSHVSEMYLGSQDNGGVHINSGIGNHAYYLFATATSKETAEQVFYKALTSYLTSKSQFIDFRIAVVQSAKDMYGEISTEVTAAKNAFDAVGIYDEEQVNPEQDLPANPGQDYLLFYNTLLPETYGTLYRSTTDGQTFDRLSSTYMKRSASVSDDGSYALFVSEDSIITALYTDPLDPQESALSDEAFWDNVAVSKDGNRVAAISTEIDTAIYVFDYESQEWGVFKLYNPTTSEGINAGGVIFADAIEFDNTGEYLIYDAYNVLYSSSGDDISYWDIGFMKVWDNTANYFGDGSIQKLYGSLPESVSIGNPTFSKNSPYIIAFDYYNSSTEEYGIFGMNLITGDLDLVIENNTIGYPSYSRNDNRIAFNTLDGGYDAVGVIELDENKITGISYSGVLIPDAKWPVYYAEGNRNLELAPVANFTVDIKSGNAPLAVQFLDLSANKPTAWIWSFPGGDPVSSNLQNPVVVYNAPGTYQVSLTSSNNSGDDIMTKSDYIYVGENTGIGSRIQEQIRYYPNPTDGILYIESARDFRISIIAVTGKVLFRGRNQTEINLSNWQPGLYILKLEIDGEIIMDKVIRK